MGMQRWTQLSDQHFHFTFTECFTYVNSFDTWQLHELETIIPILQVKKLRAQRHERIGSLFNAQQGWAEYSNPDHWILKAGALSNCFASSNIPRELPRFHSHMSKWKWNYSNIFFFPIIAHWYASWNREVCFSAIVIGSEVEMSSKHVRHVPADGFFSTYCR